MRHLVLAHFAQLTLQVGQLGDAVFGMTTQAGAGGVSAHALRIVSGQKQFAHGGEVQGRTTTNGAHHLHA